ncbi:MAG TPA: NAD-dependent succinate-semialdehyde dehydrogenase [Gammaproteobacteria bacterium]|nr:NAD-dependent succinate-semialdehyde dehydrogenase [Gammaproteobacteria bacterium]
MELQDRDLLRQQAYINGGWVDADSGARHPVHNPANGERIAHVPDCGAAETARAIEAAHAALPAWRALTAKERARLLRRWYDLIMEHQEDLAHILTLEMGKPLTEARGEIAYGAAYIDWFAEEGKRVYGEIIPEPVAGRRILATREPVGVAATITPWNFPNAMITRKVGPALAAGCTVVSKPAEASPLSALALAELADRAGIPGGVFNVVTTAQAATVGDELCASPLVRKLSFTGSTKVGKLLMKQCAATLKRLSLELGGNAPFIVFDDADLDAAVQGAMASKYRNAGQTCVCANRLLVQDGIYDAFVERLGRAVAELQVGSGLDEGVQQGPLINDAAVEKVEHHIQDALDKGARLVTGGKRHEKGGNFFQPTVLADVTPAMVCAREETFGPLAPVFRFHTEEEAIRMANDTEFGLASYFYARDIGRVWRVADALEYGIVGINEGIISTEVAPFGGMKESGYGREGSRHGIEEYLEIKYRCMGGLG